mgnify:CR=1 FL=1
MLPFLLTVWCQKCLVVVVDDESVVKMSSGDVDVEPYLNSRNTIVHGTATQILKVKCGKILSECEASKQWWLRKAIVVLGCVSEGGGGAVVVTELKKFSFVRERRTFGGGAVVRSSDVQCLGNLGLGKNS